MPRKSVCRQFAFYNGFVLASGPEKHSVEILRIFEYYFDFDIELRKASTDKMQKSDNFLVFRFAQKGSSVSPVGEIYIMHVMMLNI